MFRSSDSDKAAASHPIPFYYRIPLLYVEPLCAINGAYMLYSSPRSFLEAVSPHHDTYFPSNLTAAAAAATTASSSSTSAILSATTAAAAATPLASVRIITDMLAGMNLLFAFNLAITLRVVQDDRRLWRVLCLGMLLSDVLHVFATVREFGLATLLDVHAWRAIDWINFGIMGYMALVRACVVAGIGFGDGAKRKEGEDDGKSEKS